MCRLYLTPGSDGRFIGIDALAPLVGRSRKTVYSVLRRHDVPMRSKTYYVTEQTHPRLTRVPPSGEQPPQCKCGCGQPTPWLRVKNRWARYVKGHYTQRGPQSHTWEGGSAQLTCRVCGEPYQCPQHEVATSRFCSETCAGIAKRSPHYDGNSRWIGWDSVRKRIRKRDNWTCQDCGFAGKGKKRALHVHHLDENPTNNADANLVLLCPRCHHKRHGIETPSDWPLD